MRFTSLLGHDNVLAFGNCGFRLGICYHLNDYPIELGQIRRHGRRRSAGVLTNPVGFFAEPKRRAIRFRDRPFLVQNKRYDELNRCR